MIFSPTCQYALRALIYLATHERGGPILGRVIADAENIPRQFLAKILHSLGNNGLISSTMGPGGGYQLARPASDISVGEVVAAVDGPLVWDDNCVLGLDECNDQNCCALHEQWKLFKDNLQQSVSNLSLKEAAGTLFDKRKTLLRKR